MTTHLLTKAKHWASLSLGRAKPVTNSQRRYVRIIQSAVTALAVRLISSLVSIISVPLTVSYLGAERYGVWITISTMLAWLQIADLGLGNGLTNAVAKAYGESNTANAKRAIATSFWMLVAIGSVLAFTLIPLASTVDWVVVLGVRSQSAQNEIGSALVIALLLTIMTLPFGVVEKTLLAYQEGRTANYWSVAASLASLIGVIVVTRIQGGLVLLVSAYAGSLLAVKIASAVWLFFISKPELRPTLDAVSREQLRKLASVGGRFFIIQIAVLLIMNTDNVIIAHYLGAEAVTPYSVAWRLFSYAALPQSLIFSALWPAYTEAFVRHDTPWVKRTFKLNLASSMTLTSVIVLVLVVFGLFIINTWAGPSAVPPQLIMYWMAAWTLINVLTNIEACVLNAAGRLTGQVIYGTLTAILNVILSVLWVQVYGVTGVIAATVVAYTVCDVVPSTIETMFVLRRRPQTKLGDAVPAS